MKNTTEILAPAGSEEQLFAAVRCGANAVYLGVDNFNARRNADNFSEESLSSAVKYCHARGVKVYVTLNTLVFDNELSELYETVKAVAKSGADAVLTDDFAVISAVKLICPALSLHASTQMAVHNVSGARLLEALGFSRVVLSREMSLSEIKAVCDNTSLEIEVFVHGAHCMSASGNCYLSAMLGERSGNRGLCAQGCRLNWNAHGREYALSLKDMSYLKHIDELKNAGVISFKIEGRMKRPEYVAAAVTSLRKAVSGESYDEETLKSVFSRSGFTDGYLTEKRDLTMFGYRKKEDVTAAPAVFKELEALYRADIPVRPVSMEFSLIKGKPCVLSATSGDFSVTVNGDIGEIPKTAPLSNEICERNLKKLGGTPFFLDSLTFSNPDNLTLSASSINAARRRAVDELTEKITELKRKVYDNSTAPFVSPYIPKSEPETRIRLERFSQYSECFSACGALILDIDEILLNAEKVKNTGARFFAELPALIYPGSEQRIKEKLAEVKKLGITDGVTGNIGGFWLLHDCGFTVHGSHGLNITNTVSISEYEKLGLADTILSFELTKKRIDALGGKLRRGCCIYGNLPTMIFRACPQKTENGCGGCNGASYITDRKGINFPVLCHNKEYSVLLNSVPLYVGDRAPVNVDFYELYFTNESPEECSLIFSAFKNGENVPGQKTNGLYFRELL